MTNTRLTDPEILELRYPVLLEEFSIRRGSGGKGKWTSGDGTRRVIRFLERMNCAILSELPSRAPVRRRRRRAGRSRRQFACAVPTAASSASKAATRPCSRRARPSSSSRPPAAASAIPEAYDAVRSFCGNKRLPPPTFRQFGPAAPCQAAARSPSYEGHRAPTTKATDNEMKTADAARASLEVLPDPCGGPDVRRRRPGGRDRARLAERRRLHRARHHRRRCSRPSPARRSTTRTTTSPISICRVSTSKAPSSPSRTSTAPTSRMPICAAPICRARGSTAPR